MWTNWSGGQSCRPAATARPLDEGGLAGVVRRAAERGQTVRPLGAGHSFSGLAVTDGVHLDTSAFAGVTAVVGPPDQPRVRVRAGTTLAELHAELEARDLALEMPLDLDAPTVGGALAVGMHGSGGALGSLSSAVRSMRVVDGRGRVRDVPTAQLDAARTALGALGVLVDAELAVVPAHRVQVTRAPRPLDEVLDEDFWSGHHVAEAALFPSAPTALARWADRLDPTDDPAHADEPAATDEPGPVPADPAMATGPVTSAPKERRVGVTVAGVTGRTALGGAVVVERALPRLVPRINRVVSRLARTVSATGAMHRVLSSPPAVRYEQTEWALPREVLAGAARELLAALSGGGLEVGLPVRLRIGPPEAGWLHPAHGRGTGWLSVRVARGTDPDPVFATAWSVLAGHGGRPHWATRHDWDADRVAAAYPRLPDFLRVRDDYDPDRVFSNPALSRVLGG